MRDTATILTTDGSYRLVYKRSYNHGWKEELIVEQVSKDALDNDSWNRVGAVALNDHYGVVDDMTTNRVVNMLYRKLAFHMEKEERHERQLVEIREFYASERRAIPEIELPVDSPAPGAATTIQGIIMASMDRHWAKLVLEKITGVPEENDDPALGDSL